MKQKMRVAAALAALTLAAPALADVLPPTAFLLQKRASQSPDAYDRADAWCAGKAIGSACEVPGNAFEGGGKGRCEQVTNRESHTLDALCRVSITPVIERKLPEGGYVVDKRLCELAQRDAGMANSLKREQAGCTPQAPLADQFCGGKKVGDACQAELSLEGSRAAYGGRCIAETQEGSFYHYGHNPKQRAVILCQPVKPASHDMQASSPPGWWQKLVN